MVMSVVSLLSSMFTVYMEGHSDVSRPPRWIRIFCFRFLSRAFCIHNEIPDVPDDNVIHPIVNQSELIYDDVKSMEEAKPNKMATLNDVMSKLDEFLKHVHERERSDAIVNEWKLVAKTIDRLLFWICALITSIYFIYTIVVIHEK